MTAFSLSLSTAVIAAALAGAPAQQPAGTPQAGPETITLMAAVPAPATATGSVDVPITIRIDRYTPEHARTTMVDGLKYGGYPGFLKALREAPAAGTLEVGGKKFTIRWARQEKTDTGRTLSFVTDTPVYFVGGWQNDAKSTKGYELAVVQLTLDGSGKGEGTMAAAARVKPQGTTGVQIDDYAGTPVKLSTTAPVRK